MQIHHLVRLLRDLPEERLHAGDVGEILAIYPISADSQELLYCIEFQRRDDSLYDADGTPWDLGDIFCSVDLRAEDIESFEGQ